MLSISPELDLALDRASGVTGIPRASLVTMVLEQSTPFFFELGNVIEDAAAKPRESIQQTIRMVTRNLALGTGAIDAAVDALFELDQEPPRGDD